MARRPATAAYFYAARDFIQPILALRHWDDAGRRCTTFIEIAAEAEDTAKALNRALGLKAPRRHTRSLVP